MNAHDLIKEAIAEKGKFDSVYWIACGGSMIDLIPAHELLQREATTFTSYIYTAREFDIMRPRRLGEKSLVIACSHSGNTPRSLRLRDCPCRRRYGDRPDRQRWI